MRKLPERQNKFLGTGWAFPPAFDKGPNRARLSSDEGDIRESLTILLGTLPGERMMRPKYGCDLSNLVYEPLTSNLITFIQDLVRSAILLHEPRIKVERVAVVEATDFEGKIEIIVDYLIRTTNKRENLVYPFYQHRHHSLV